MRAKRHRCRLVGLGLLLSASAATGTLTYPGAAPCNTTLQACVQGAASGDRIEIATAAAIDEGISIRKSVTLTGASGVTPVIGAGPTMRAVRIETYDDEPLSVSLRGLTLSNAIVLVVLVRGTGHRIEIADCGVSSGSPGNSGLRVQAAAPAEIVVRNSDFATGDSVIDFSSIQPAGEVVFTMIGNRIAAATSGYEGLSLDLRGAGTTTVNLWSNVVRDVTLSGVQLVTLETVHATANFVNNTIDRADGGFFVRTPASGSTLAVNLFNNVVTHSVGRYTSGAGLAIEAASPQLSITAGFNDFFANAGADVLQGYSLGPLFAADPQFVDGPGSDYRLKPASLLIGAGTNTPPGGLPPVDAAGNQRVAGGVVDVGAFEFGSSPPSTTSTTITTLACQPAPSFEGILCRLEALAAAVQSGLPSGRLRDGLLAAVGQAKARTLDASTAVRKRAAKRSTRRALHSMATFRGRLRSRRAKQLDASVRDDLLSRAADVVRDLSALGR